MEKEKTLLNIRLDEKNRLEGYFEGCRDTNKKWMLRVVVWGPIAVMMCVAFIFYIMKNYRG